MTVSERAAEIHRRITAACERVGRDPHGVTLVAVSKKQPLDRIVEYRRWTEAQGGVCVLGENYVQEWRDKAPHFDAMVSCHLIGPLQRNKAREAVRLFDVIQSIHSLSVCEAVANEAEKAGKVQRVFLQVNVSADPKKSGIPVDEIAQTLVQCLTYRSVQVDGLMTITEFYEEPELVRSDFRTFSRLGKMCEEIVKRPLGLSMGMSSDFEIAVEEGATFVRVGSALFGGRG